MDVKVALADTSAHNYSQLDGQDDGKVVPALYDSGSDVPFTDPPYPFLDGADGAWHESMLAYASESSMRETTSRATVAEGRLRCVVRCCTALWVINANFTSLRTYPTDFALFPIG